MKWIVIIGLTYMANASSLLPEMCKPFKKMSVQETLGSKFDYASSCKVLQKQLKKAKNERIPKKLLTYGMAYHTLSDLGLFGQNIDMHKKAFQAMFKQIHTDQFKKQQVSNNDGTTLYQGIYQESSKKHVYRYYFDNDGIQVSKTVFKGIKNTKSKKEDSLWVVSTKSSCLKVRILPSEKSKVVDCIDPGSPILPVDAQVKDRYMLINYLGGTGWVSNSFIKKIQE